jgi:hypothetical protein
MMTVKIDKTPPILNMPTLAVSYIYNSSLNLTFGATDALSGTANIQGTLNGNSVTSGSLVTLNKAGANTFTLTATDVAGNTTSQNITFSVIYSYNGFLSPILNDGSRVFKLGSTVPVKFQLTDVNGTNISTTTATLTVQQYSGTIPNGTPVDATPSGSANTGDYFRYDSTSSQYIYNLSTKPLPTGTWQLQAHLDDGTVHTVMIGLK